MRPVAEPDSMPDQGSMPDQASSLDPPPKTEIWVTMLIMRKNRAKLTTAASRTSWSHLVESRTRSPCPDSFEDKVASPDSIVNLRQDRGHPARGIESKTTRKDMAKRTTRSLPHHYPPPP